jgi:HEPN domain-containing protein
MGTPDFARQLLTAAERDLRVWRKLVDDMDIHDAMLGFHAQQAVEKCLKAVLARARVAFRRTHDIAELMDALSDAGLSPPPHAQRLDELNPFAVEARYGMTTEQGLDRPVAGEWVEAVFAWACVTLRDSSAT